MRRTAWYDAGRWPASEECSGRDSVMARISRIRRVIAPIVEWLNSGGSEKIAIGLGCLFLVVVITTAIVLVANDVFGLGIFGSGTGCTNPDPYHPCRPVDTR